MELLGPSARVLRTREKLPGLRLELMVQGDLGLMIASSCVNRLVLVVGQIERTRKLVARFLTV
jgi:hypothetical protein